MLPLRINHGLRILYRPPKNTPLTANLLPGGGLLTQLLNLTGSPALTALCADPNQAEQIVGPEAEVVDVNGRPACVAEEENGRLNALMQVDAPIPDPYAKFDRTFAYFKISAFDPNIFWPTLESIQFTSDAGLPGDTYVRGVVDVFEVLYQYEDEVDWPAVEAEALRQIGPENSTEDGYTAVRWLTTYLGETLHDHHNFIYSPIQAEQFETGDGSGAGFYLSPDGVIILIVPDSPAAAVDLRLGDIILSANGLPPSAPEHLTADSFELEIKRDGDIINRTVPRGAVPQYIPPEGRRLSDGVAYIKTYGMFGAPEQGIPYMQTAFDLYRELDTGDTCGWILDLRQNTGGYIFPIIASVTPFVGEGELYKIRTSNNSDYASPVYFRNGIITPNVSFGIVAEDPYQLRELNPPLAVLIGPGTGSAGELSTLVVSQRPGAQARLFGEPTAGLNTSVAMVNLADGGQLFLSVDEIVDLNGVTHPEGIQPDEPMTIVYDERYGTPEDPLILAAQKWLEQEHNCR